MKMHTPDPRPGKRRWYCGPFAFAAITGHDFENTRAYINAAKGRSENTGVMGTSDSEMRRALILAGYDLKLHYKAVGEYSKRTLNTWMKELNKDDDSLYLVEVTGHWIVLQGRSKMIDNHTEWPVAAFAGPWQRKQIKQAFRVVKKY